MTWTQVFATMPEGTEDTSPFVEIFRARGVENTAESGREISGCLAVVPGVEERAEELKRALAEVGATDVREEPVPEVDWEHDWRRFFTVRRVGQRFVVRPSWEPYEALPDDLVITLDPGEAFGTGDHPTTRGCLALMEKAQIKGSRVADLGCGSGILAVGACLVGAREVVASDLDAAAVEVSRENARRNGVSFVANVGEGVEALYLDGDEPGGEWLQDELPGGVDVGVQPARPLGEPFDVVISNIISAVLIRLSAQVAAIVRPGGDWIVSGIIEENWPGVLAAATDAGFVWREEIRETGWVAARFERGTDAAPAVS